VNTTRLDPGDVASCDSCGQRCVVIRFGWPSGERLGSSCCESRVSPLPEGEPINERSTES
jgi:hypothetical protein